jgi:hypothetical protein
MKAIQYSFHRKHIGGGIDIYPCRLGIGIGWHYWPCIFAPKMCLYFGPIKLWLYFSIRKPATGKEEEHG